MQQFTDKAKVALQKAAKAAKDLHQSYIGSEHILVGLVKEKTGVAARVLAENGVDEHDQGADRTRGEYRYAGA